jgi:hypothetical protein
MKISKETRFRRFVKSAIPILWDENVTDCYDLLDKIEENAPRRHKRWCEFVGKGQMAIIVDEELEYFSAQRGKQ